MKSLISLLTCLLLLASAAPAALARVPRQPVPLADQEETTSQVLLVSVDRKLTPNELQQLLAKYWLAVVYDYKNFNMYALGPQKPCTKFRLQRIRKHLQQEPHIIAVEPDRVMRVE